MSFERSEKCLCRGKEVNKTDKNVSATIRLQLKGITGIIAPIGKMVFLFYVEPTLPAN